MAIEFTAYLAVPVQAVDAKDADIIETEDLLNMENAADVAIASDIKRSSQTTNILERSGTAASLEELISRLTRKRDDGATVRRAIIEGRPGVIHIGDFTNNENYVALHEGQKDLSSSTIGYLEALKQNPLIAGVVLYNDGTEKIVTFNDCVYNNNGELLYANAAAPVIAAAAPTL